MRIDARLPLAAALALLGGCALIDGTDDGLSEPSGDSPLAFAFASCSPVDGPATDLYIAEAATSCRHVEEAYMRAPQATDAAYVRIALYGTQALEAPATFTLDPDGDDDGFAYDSGGYASVCAAGGACLLAPRGRVVLEAPSAEGTIHGTAYLEPEGGEPLVRPFVLRACRRSRPLICG